MKISEPQNRLDKFWGKVDDRHIRLICEHLKGDKILDIGCGYGTTTNYVTNILNHDCIGIDYDKRVIEMCKNRYENCNFAIANAEKLPFEDDSFDTIILRDALHHFYQEANFEKIKKELLRVSKDTSRIIFFDPNINLLLKTMRKIASHKDAECDYETAISILKDLGFEIIYKKFNTIYSLPLSGGYVGINFVPKILLFEKFILKTEEIFERVVNSSGFGRNLCWRYLIVGERNKV